MTISAQACENECCCKCAHQETITCHPGNQSAPLKGDTDEVLGWGCLLLIAERERGLGGRRSSIIAMDTRHGLCECFAQKYDKDKEDGRENMLQRMWQGVKRRGDKILL